MPTLKELYGTTIDLKPMDCKNCDHLGEKEDDGIVKPWCKKYQRFILPPICDGMTEKK